MRWVLDASLTLAWCFKEGRTAAVEALAARLKTTPAIVPQNWRLEVANILLNAVRRGRLTEIGRADFIAFLEAQPIYVDGQTEAKAFRGTLSIAEKHRLTIYDAAYPELAVRMQLPIASLDQELVDAARREGLPIL